MKHILIIFLFFQQLLPALDNTLEVAEFLTNIEKITEGRWSIRPAENNMIYLNSKEEVTGEMNSGSYAVGESKYKLHFRFKIVKELSGEEQIDKHNELDNLRKLGSKIKHKEIKGYYYYEPKGKEEWSLVLKIKKAEQAVNDIPEYSFKTVYFSEEYSMSSFTPNKKDKRALLYKKDVEGIFKLLKRVSKTKEK